MMSVERVLEYRDLEPEKQPETPQKISESWPEAGRIQFRNVFYRYFTEGEPVLRGLSFVIRPKEKIGMENISNLYVKKITNVKSIYRIKNLI